MNFRLSFIVRSLLCFTLTVASIAPVSVAEITGGQTKGRLNAKAYTQESSASQQKALALLDQLLNQTKDFGDGFYSPMKVIVFQAQAADLLWDYDQTRARSLFTTAMKSAISLRPKVEGMKVGLDDNDTRVKKMILDLVLPRGSTFAEQLARLVLESYPQRRVPDSGIYWLYLREQTALYTQIAKHIAAANPQHAAELLRSSFNTSYSYTQLEALNALRRYAPARADEIFLYALTLVKAKPTNLSNKIGLFATYLFPEIQNEAGVSIKRLGYAGEPAQVNPALIKPFLEFVYDTFMPQPVAAQTAENNEFGSASFDYHTMQGLAPHFDRYLPEKAAAYRAHVKEIVTSIKKAGRKDAFDREDDAWGKLFRQNVQEMLSRAAAAKTQEKRNAIYLDAVGLLMYRDADYDQALRLLDKVSDDYQFKSNTLLDIHHLRIEKAIKDGDADKAYSYIQVLPNADKSLEQSGSYKPWFLINTARLYARKGEGEQAKALLEEAKLELVGLQNDSERASQMRRLASVAVEISPEFGFQQLKEAIFAINGVKKSEESSWVTEDGKISFSGNFDFDDNFAPLARVDFDRVLQLAKTLTSKEGMLLAQFAICKGVLEKSATKDK